MDQNQKQIDIDKFETALANTPEEVRKFLWSEPYKNLLLAIQKKFELSNEQKGSVDAIIFESLTGTGDEKSIEQKAGELRLEEAKQDELLSYIFHYFIEPSINKTEEVFELEKRPEDSGEKVIDAPTPIQALASIKERLSQTSSIAPTKRDYSVERPETSSTQADKAAKPIFDIYREPPTK